MKRLSLAIALICTAGAAYAQSPPYAYPTDPPIGPVHIDRQGAPKDATGARIDGNNDRVIGSDKWRRDQGDPGTMSGPSAPGPSATVPEGGQRASIAAHPPQPGQMIPAGRDAAFSDEYGFKYDGQGNRIDGRGNLISPQSTRP